MAAGREKPGVGRSGSATGGGPARRGARPARRRAAPDDADEGPSRPSREREDDDRSGVLPELARRALSLGLSGFFLTEETLRRALGDTLPRDWVDFAAEQSDRARSEFIEKLARELAGTLESLDLVEILERFLAGKTIEVDARIRIRADETEGARPGSPRLRFRVAADE